MDQLLGLRRADAAIVGGGLTGLLLGASLVQSGMTVGIVEAGDIPVLPSWEAASFDVPLLTRIYSTYGAEPAQSYVQALQTQFNSLLAAPLSYVRQAEVYTYARRPTELPLLDRQHELCTRLGIPVSIAPDAGGCPFPVELSIMMRGVLVDMSRWMAALCGSIRRGGGRIYLHSRVVSLDGSRVCTPHGCLHAKVIILTTGMPLGLRDRRLLSLMATHTLAHCHLTGGAPLHSIQRAISCGLNLTPTPTGIIVSQSLGRCGTCQPQRSFSLFEHTLKTRLPDFQQNDVYFTQVVRTADGLPIIGALPGSNVLCASGVGDILSAMHAAEMLTRHIMGRPSPEDACYVPLRQMTASPLRRERYRSIAQRLMNLPLRNMPVCAHCGSRMRYFSPASRWECPICGSCCTMLGQPLTGPGMVDVQVSPRQRPLD